MKKLFLIITTLLLLTLITAALWAYMAFFHTKPLTQDELKDLTPNWTRATQGNWSPWYTDPTDPTTTKQWNPTASFNAWLATIPDNQKAWPALIDISIGQEHLFDRELTRAEPGTEEWDKLTQLLNQPETNAIIAQLKEALTRPVLGCGMYASTGTHEHQALLKHGIADNNWTPNPDPNPNGMDILLPALGKLRGSSNLLKSAAINELSNNNPSEFVELIEVIYTSSQLADETPLVIGQLVRIAIEAIANDLILWSLEQHPDSFTDQHLATLSSIVEGAGIQTFIWEGEALFFRDTLRRMVIDDGPINPAGVGTLNNTSSPGGPTHLPDAQLHSSIQRLFYVHTLIVKQAETRSRIPWDPSLTPSDDIYEQQKDSLNEVGRLLMGILLPALDKAASRFQSIAQESIGVRTVIALHRHKLRHGSFPATLNDLDQEFITFDPMDIFTGQPLHYQLTDQAPMVYALGQDRDDDAGRFIPSVQFIQSKPVDADWPMFSSHKLDELYPDE